MRDLIEGALDDRVLVYLPETLETEGMPAWERERLLLCVVVLLETHTAFKYRLHFYIILMLVFLLLSLFP